MTNLIALMALLTVPFFDVGFGFLLLFVFSLWRIFYITRNEDNYIVAVVYASVVIYYSLAPFFFIEEAYYFWGAPPPSDMAYAAVFFNIVIWLIGFEISSCFYKKPLLFNDKKEIYLVGKSSCYSALFVSIVSYFILYFNYDINFNPRGLFLDDSLRVYETLIYSRLPKAIILVSAVVLLINLFYRRNLETAIMFSLVAIMALHGASPTSTPRQLIILCCLPVIFFSSYDSIRRLSSVLIVFLIVLLGPVLNYFSRDVFYSGVYTGFPFSPDFDAIFISASLFDEMILVGDFSYGFGRYILNALSFILPRELKLFPDFDPLATSHAKFIFSQTNVSLPPFVTVYFDFWFFGVLGFGFALGWIVRWAGSRIIGVGSGIGFRDLMLAIFVSSLIPLMRGPIMGWGVFLIAGVGAAWVIYYMSWFFSKVIRKE